MKLEDIRTVTVIGAGNMGHQLALQVAISGFEAICHDIDAAALGEAEAFAETYLAGRVEKERLTREQADAARDRIRFTADLADAVAQTDYVIEAVTENLSLKRGIFKDLDRLAPAHAILATNSSTFVSSRIADVTARPSKVINLHFFNPALVMKLVEVVQGPHVSDETAQLSMDFARAIGKEPVHLKKEVDGFLLNRILLAIWTEANWLLDMGVASFEDIDKACMFGAGHPMGPFRLQDLTGIDLIYHVAMEAFAKSGDRADLPTPSVVQRFARGEFGEKTGKGWYKYGSKA